jgi:hypothetical protein
MLIPVSVAMTDDEQRDGRPIVTLTRSTAGG